MKLEVFERLCEQATKFGPGRPRALQEFLAHPLVMQLGWPDDVVEQWLFDHASHPAFHIDYGHIDLETLDWTLERLETPLLLDVPTGDSEVGAIEGWAKVHEHAVRTRETSGSPLYRGIQEKWDEEGTWLRPPLLIEQSLIGNGGGGLQLVEGRTRVGVLRGRHADGLRVADTHLTWMGRFRMSAFV